MQIVVSANIVCKNKLGFNQLYCIVRLHMIKLLTFTCSMVFAICEFGQSKYLDPVFSKITRLDNIVYGSNITLENQDTASVELHLDFYTATDNQVPSPLMILVHSGFLLPTIKNNLLTGTKKDSALVETAFRLAALGYRVAAIDYRLGWDNLNNLDHVRKSTFIQAVYRAVQDTRTAVRFFKYSFQEADNPYQIDTSRVGIWGFGIGSLISCITTYQIDEARWHDQALRVDLNQDEVPDPVINFSELGNSMGTSYGLGSNGDTLSLPNYPNFSSNVGLTVACQGTLPDTNWIQPDGNPGIFFHVATDPIFPQDEFFVIDPVNGDLMIPAMGSNLISQRADNLALNEGFVAAQLSDPVTDIKHRSGINPEGFCPLNTPFESDNAPWDWWDPSYWSNIEHPFCEGAPPPACSFHTIGLFSNPNVSASKGRTYIDTMIQYFAPRAAIALNLETSVSNEQIIQDPAYVLFPNPTQGNLFLHTTKPIKQLNLYNQLGKLVNLEISSFSSYEVQVNVNRIPAGTYYLAIAFTDRMNMVRIIVL